MVDWSMMRDFSPGPMVPFHGAENNARGRGVCCLEPSSSLSSGTTHMQVNNVELRNASKKKGSSEPGSTTASLSRKVGHFKAANDEKIHRLRANGGAHRIRGMLRLPMTVHCSANSVSYEVGTVYFYFSACNCHSVRKVRDAKEAKPQVSRDALAAAAVEELRELQA